MNLVKYVVIENNVGCLYLAVLNDNKLIRNMFINYLHF